MFFYTEIHTRYVWQNLYRMSISFYNSNTFKTISIENGCYFFKWQMINVESFLHLVSVIFLLFSVKTCQLWLNWTICDWTIFHGRIGNRTWALFFSYENPNRQLNIQVKQMYIKVTSVTWKLPFQMNVFFSFIFLHFPYKFCCYK